MRETEARFLLRRTKKMIVGQIGPSRLHVRFAQIILRNEILRRLFKRVIEHGKAVFPVAGLPPGQAREENQDHRDSSTKYLGPPRPSSGMICDPPHRSEER